MAKPLIEDTLVVSLEETVEARAAQNSVVAEGAGAVSVADALSGGAGMGKIVCIISGGNIDLDKLVKIFQGKIP